jgi:hypothetical protein
MDKTLVSPLTLAELLYISLAPVIARFPGDATRYPITGIGSIYPSNTYMMSTNNAEARTWTVINTDNKVIDYVFKEFPLRNETFFDAMAVNAARLGRLGADHDGDMMSWSVAYSEEAVTETRNYFNSRKGYIGPDGQFMASVALLTTEFAFHNLSRNPT